MTTQQRYAMPVDPNEAIIPGQFDSLMRWEYEDGRDSLLNLYEKGKKLQWNANTRIDWSLDLDPENPAGTARRDDLDLRLRHLEPPDASRSGRTCDATCRRGSSRSSCTASRARCVCTAKIVQQVPSVDAKFYAATQVMDEARHVEVYARLLHEKFELAYPITPTLKRSSTTCCRTRAGT